MFVFNTYYNVVNDLSIIQSVRNCLFNFIYNDINNINYLQNCIGRYIDCIDIRYDPQRFSFILKIKKTSMKKHNKFKQNSEFYYTLVQNAYLDFFREKKNDIVRAFFLGLSNSNQIISGEGVYNDLLLIRPNILWNLFHVSCIADNIVEIKL